MPLTLAPALYDAFETAMAEQNIGAHRNTLAAMINHESGWDPFIIGDSGHSVGLLQLHDMGQGAGMSVIERQDPLTNLRVGFRAFRIHLAEFGNVESALAAHNAGGPAMRAEIARGGNWGTLYGGSVALLYVRPILAAAASIGPITRASDEAPAPVEDSYRDRVSVSRRVAVIQLGAIWGECARLRSFDMTGTANRIEQAIIAIKDDAGLN